MKKEREGEGKKNANRLLSLFPSTLKSHCSKTKKNIGLFFLHLPYPLSLSPFRPFKDNAQGVLDAFEGERKG